MKLRPYQQQALEAVRECYRQGHRSALVVMPTGTGKTVLFAEISRLAKGPVLVVAHRQELVDQARDKIAAWCDDVVAVEMAEQRGLTAPQGRRPKITVASVQTLQRRLTRVPRDAFKIVVIDEAHHGVADSYKALIDHFDAWLLGVTATPDRADRRPLGDVFSSVAFDYDMQHAIQDGWLCPIRSFLVETEADFSGIRKVAGELATGDVERELTKEPHLVEIAKPIVEERGDRPTMVFAASVAHAHALCRVIRDLAGGGPDFAAAVDGASARDYRSETVERFRAGEIQVLVNCSLFTEGFDVPQVSLVAVARPVLSRAFYAQMVGRGTRLAPGKQDLLVLDFVPGNCRHSLVQAVDIFADHDADVVEHARAITQRASLEGNPMLLEEALELARQEIEAGAVDVTYRLRRRDPFAAVGLDVGAMLERPSRRREPATSEQRKYLLRAGIQGEHLAQLSSDQAEELSERLRERKAVGLCSPKQAFELAAYGVDASEMYQDQARELLRYVRQERKSRSDASIRAELRGTGRPAAGP
ncbi:MAG: DEAD/DEAH box helicase [Planctomycetes bacterium]|nr:DEAD/DEAH box helicase [Planctomycetota bacterium]